MVFLPELNLYPTLYSRYFGGNFLLRQNSSLVSIPQRTDAASEMTDSLSRVTQQKGIPSQLESNFSNIDYFIDIPSGGIIEKLNKTLP